MNQQAAPSCLNREKHTSLSPSTWQVSCFLPSLSLFTFMHWRRKWQPTPVFLPGESQGQRSLVGCHLWGHTESDVTGATWQRQQKQYLFYLVHPQNAYLKPKLSLTPISLRKFLSSIRKPCFTLFFGHMPFKTASSTMLDISDIFSK